MLAAIKAYKEQSAADYDELIAALEVLSGKRNTLELDEDGFFYVQAHGPIEDVIKGLEIHLKRLNNIKAQKEKS